MARHTSLTHTLGRHISQRGQEEQQVLPSPCHRMDDHHPNASAPLGVQATVLALWSLGMVLARSCALTAVTVFLAVWLRRKERTVRTVARVLLRGRGQPGHPTSGSCGGTLFCATAALGLSGWQGTQLALALDVTTLGLRFTVLAISVVYRGCAMPVAWKLWPPTSPMPGAASGYGCCASCGRPFPDPGR